MPAAQPSLIHRAWVALLLVTVFAVYAPSLTNQYALDDGIVARATLPSGAPNRMTATLRPLPDYFTSGYWIGNDGELSPLFRPVTVLSYALTNLCTGGVSADPGTAAFAHHLLNVLLHVLATWLALRLLAPLVVRPWMALLAAAVFGLHAIHSEVVAGIVGRAELLGFCCGAGALLLCLAGHRHRGAGRGIRLGISAVLLFLAFCSKENAIAWAPFLVVYHIAHDQHRGDGPGLPRRCLQAGILALVPTLAFLALRQIALAEVPSPFPVTYLANPLHDAPVLTRWLTGVSIWGFGLYKCVLPINLASDYGPATFELLDSPLDLGFVAAAVALGGLLGVGLWCRRTPLLFLGATCFLGFSFLITNLPLAIGTVFGERLYFSPSLGIACLFAWALGRVTRPLLIVLPAIGWLGLGVVVILGRNATWFDEVSRYSADAQANPRCLRLLDAYAGHLDRLNRKPEAEAMWRRALALDPQFADGLSSLGGFLARQGRHDEAEKVFQRALAAPTGSKQLRHITHYNLAVLYNMLERADDSDQQLRLAWQEDSAFVTLHEPLLTRSHAQLSVDEMAKLLETGQRRLPDHPTWSLQHGYLALSRNDPPAAIKHLRRALRMRPGHPETRWVLAATLLQSGQRELALPLLNALRKDKGAPEEYRKLARKAWKQVK